MRTENNRIERLFDIATLFFPTFLQINKERLEGREGVAMNILLDTGPPYMVPQSRIIGNLSKEKAGEKAHFAREKITRICSKREYTSFESADDEKKQYGGGIKANDVLYLSASGFPPDLDQEFVILIAMMAGELKLENYVRIQILSEKAVEKIKGE